MIRNSILTLAVALVLACGGGDEGGAPTDVTPGGGAGGSLCDGTAAVTGCRIGWSGAVQGTKDCIAYSSAAQINLLPAEYTFPIPAMKVTFTSTAAVGTYTLADVDFAEGGVASSQVGYDYYVHKWDGGTTGSLAFHVTSFDSGGKPHGFFQATAQGQDGHIGTAEVCGQF